MKVEIYKLIKEANHDIEGPTKNIFMKKIRTLPPM